MRMRTSATGKHLRPGLGGFTLVEMLVVLTLIAMAAGMIVSRMGRSFDRRAVRECAGKLAYTVRTVRELAVARQVAMGIEFAADETGYCVTTASSSEANGSGGMVPIRLSWLKAQRWPDNVRLVEYRTADGRSRSSGARQVTFSADGTSSGVSIRLACGTEEYCLIVYPQNGRVDHGDSTTFSPPQQQYDLGD